VVFVGFLADNLTFYLGCTFYLLVVLRGIAIEAGDAKDLTLKK